jgi:hypothetical protein
LKSAAAAADVEVVWMQTALDAGFSVICERRADAGLGWLTTKPEALPVPLDAMVLGDFGPEVWVPSSHPAARRGTIGIEALAGMDVVHGPRRAEPGTYDAWTRAMRAVNPRFEFTDPPFRHSLPMTLAFAATAERPTALLTGPVAVARTPHGLIRLPRPAAAHDMVRVGLDRHPLTATAALVWNGDLPRPLQQMLFETADGITPQLAAIGLLAAACQVTKPILRPLLDINPDEPDMLLNTLATFFAFQSSANALEAGGLADYSRMRPRERSSPSGLAMVKGGDALQTAGFDAFTGS